MAGLTPQWAEADAHASLGLPVTGGRLRVVKKVLGKLLWPFLRHQVVVNRGLLSEIDAIRQRLDRDEFQLLHVADDLEHHSAVLVRHEEPLDRHEFLLKHLEPAIEDLVRQFDLVEDKIDLGQRQALARYHEGIGPLRSAITELGEQIEALEDGLDATRRSISETAGELEALRERAEREEGWRRALDEVWLRLSQLDLFLTEARRAFPEPIAAERIAAIPSGFGALEPVFEEAFRGPVELVRSRVAPYVHELAAAPGPVLDVGCGRGELLELLVEADVEAYGVDTSAAHVAACTTRGLDVRLEEARAHLRRLEPGSLGAVVAIQVVEHLATDELIELIELAARALRPGGTLLLETQNPENLVVGSSSFYLDPTHRRPIPPQLLAFLVGARGFDEPEIRRLERREAITPLAGPKPDDPWADVLTPVVDALNARLFGPPDYAVVARRP